MMSLFSSRDFAFLYSLARTLTLADIQRTITVEFILFTWAGGGASPLSSD